MFRCLVVQLRQRRVEPHQRPAFAAEGVDSVVPDSRRNRCDYDFHADSIPPGTGTAYGNSEVRLALPETFEELVCINGFDRAAFEVVITTVQHFARIADSSTTTCDSVPSAQAARSFSFFSSSGVKCTSMVRFLSLQTG